jgi:ketosteroid isomerase-like protein
VSAENVEVVRSAWEAFARHDNAAIFPMYHAEVEVRDVFHDRVYRGLDGVREFVRDWLSAWDGYRSEVEEWIDAGDNVVAILHAWAHGKQSGVPVEMYQAHVWTLREGKLWRLRIYPTKEDAVKALGLSE